MEVWSDRGSTCKFRKALRVLRNLHVDPLSLHTSMRNKQVEFNPWIKQRVDDFMTLGATVAEWLSSWLAEQEVRGSIPGLVTWISEIVISCFQVAIWLKYRWSDVNPQYNQPTSWPWSWPLCWNSFFTDLVTTGSIVFHKHFVLIFCQFVEGMCSLEWACISHRVKS